jgi:A/G-specific adenine glycosylase
MDLGATLCRPASPACDQCPLAPSCAWRGRGEDPARGSAGVSRAQAPFDGSDRQARGRLLKALGSAPVRAVDAAAVMHRAPDAAERLVESLVADGLAVVDGTTLRLP